MGFIVHCKCGGTHTVPEWLHCEYLRAKTSQKASALARVEDRQMSFDFGEVTNNGSAD